MWPNQGSGWIKFGLLYIILLCKWTIMKLKFIHCTSWTLAYTFYICFVVGFVLVMLRAIHQTIWCERKQRKIYWFKTGKEIFTSHDWLSISTIYIDRKVRFKHQEYVIDVKEWLNFKILIKGRRFHWL